MFHQVQVEYNDIVLLVSLAVFCSDLWEDWDSFSACSRPIHQWLFTSCNCAMAFRMLRILASCNRLGESAEGAGDADTRRASGGRRGGLLLDLRLKGAIPRSLVTFTWVLAVPFFMGWTVLGTVWLWKVYKETPDCLEETFLWFSLLWLALCYYWIVVHTSLGIWTWRLKRRVQRAEAGQHELEGEDTLRRLSSSAIKTLPCETVPCAESLLGNCECPICIEEMQPGDEVRALPNCGHAFHRSCIDLWLARRADCPMCKRHVMAE